MCIRIDRYSSFLLLTAKPSITLIIVLLQQTRAASLLSYFVSRFRLACLHEANPVGPCGHRPFWNATTGTTTCANRAPAKTKSDCSIWAKVEH